MIIRRVPALVVVMTLAVTFPVSASTPPPVSTPNTTIPAGCDLPTPVQATFVGSLTATDRRTGRFEVRQLRGGSLDGFSVNGLVDVDYGDDIRFLDVLEDYIVAVGVDDDTGRLMSKVRDPEPLFGGNQVIGIDERPLNCPEVEDGVRTVTMNGTSVESGVLAPLSADRNGLLRALTLPALWVFGGLVALAIWAGAVRGLGRRLRASWNGEPVSRRGARPRRGPADR
ncbi:MAG: hypothetical protein O3C62_09910 [Actinomycetota bacterium]|nr:hypothetical protein [Actinomycetota bacterium]MDA2970986.1 hypothetical protein [Actinomycetota bacterium]MDA3001981.1 hypothetical protein [Actinomycetota bacterium]